MLFTAQIIVMNHHKIKNWRTLVVYCHTARAPCRLQSIIAKLDKSTGEVIEVEPQTLKNGDSVIVELVPERAIVVESFSEYP